jgi:hypothetical protein
VRVAQHQVFVVRQRTRRRHPVAHIAHAQRIARIGIPVVALMFHAAIAQHNVCALWFSSPLYFSQAIPSPGNGPTPPPFF